MEWTETTEKPPQPSWEMKGADVRVSVNPASDDDGQRWQYFSLFFGRFTDRPDEKSLRQWPREALILARTALEAFEAELDEAETCAEAIA